jgi:hypothetical protein
MRRFKLKTVPMPNDGKHVEKLDHSYTVDGNIT